jgi:anti-anti-sigma factor
VEHNKAKLEIKPAHTKEGIMIRYTNVTEKDGVLILTPLSNLVGGRETDSIGNLLCKYAAKGDQHIVVDMRKIAFINAAGLRALEKGLDGCNDNASQLRICNATKRINYYMVYFALARRFEVTEDVPEAIANFDWTPQPELEQVGSTQGFDEHAPAGPP